MSSSTAAAAMKRKRPAFSPPRPKASRGVEESKASANKPNSQAPPRKSRKPTQLAPVTPEGSESTEDSGSESESNLASALRSESSESEPEYVLAEVTRNKAAENDEPSVPLALIHTLLNYHFSDKDKIRITNDAKAVIGKYVDTFVREAIARSAFERQEKSAGDGAGELTSRGDDGWLEVEDLERMAPQLVLDF